MQMGRTNGIAQEKETTNKLDRHIWIFCRSNDQTQLSGHPSSVNARESRSQSNLARQRILTSTIDSQCSPKSTPTAAKMSHHPPFKQAEASRPDFDSAHVLRVSASSAAWSTFEYLNSFSCHCHFLVHQDTSA